MILPIMKTQNNSIPGTMDRCITVSTIPWEEIYTAQHRGSTRSIIPLTEKRIAKLEREKIHAWILQRVMKFCSLLCWHSCNSIALGLN
jgi:hypothetical protein